MLLDTPIGVGGSNPFVQNPALSVPSQQQAFGGATTAFGGAAGGGGGGSGFPGASIGAVFGNNLNRVNPAAAQFGVPARQGFQVNVAIDSRQKMDDRVVSIEVLLY